MVRPVTFSCGHGHLWEGLATASGANGVGALNDGRSFLRSNSYNYVETSTVLGSGTWDFSHDLIGCPFLSQPQWLPLDSVLWQSLGVDVGDNITEFDRSGGASMHRALHPSYTYPARLRSLCGRPFLVVMWVIGILLLTVVAIALGQLFVRRGASSPGANLWDLPRTTATYTSIVGMLAGFTAVVTMFFANLTVARSSPEYENVIGMLLIAFLLFVAAAMQFGTTPNLPDKSDEHYLLIQRISYQLANLCYFCAIAASWLSLRLFLEAIGLPYLAGIFTWILLFAVFSGSLRMAQFAYRMSSLSLGACIAVPFIGFGLASAYRFLIVDLIPELKPGSSEPFLIAVCLFVAGSAGFMMQSATTMLGDAGTPSSYFNRNADRLLLGYLQAITVLVALLWLAVALN